MESLFERVPRRRGNRWSSANVEERWDDDEEVEEVEGDACWGCGAVSCVFKRARNGRLLCRPG